MRPRGPGSPLVSWNSPTRDDGERRSGRMRTRERLTSAWAISAVVLLCLGVLPSPAAGQADCPRGELDKRFCDRNGDMVADPPDRKSVV